MNTPKTIQWLIIIALVTINILAFHDITEPHSVRDWLTLATSILIAYAYMREKSFAAR